MKINIYHIDTCLPDFFCGHHLAHLQVPVDRDTSISDLQQMLTDELYQGAVSGSDSVTHALAAYTLPDVMLTDEAESLGLEYTPIMFSKYYGNILPNETNKDIWEDYCDKVYESSKKAVEEMTSRSEFPFRDLDPADCEEEQVYAYFVLEMIDYED